MRCKSIFVSLSHVVDQVLEFSQQLIPVVEEKKLQDEEETKSRSYYVDSMTLVNNNDDYTRQSLKHNQHKEQMNEDACNKKMFVFLRNTKFSFGS